jgi:hypothetical protein
MKIRSLDLFPTLFKNTLHRDWLLCVAQVFRAHTGVTENARELHKHLRQEDAAECHSGVTHSNGNDHVIIFRKFDGGLYGQKWTDPALMRIRLNIVQPTAGGGRSPDGVEGDRGCAM